MTTSVVILFMLIAMVAVFLLACWLSKTFASMSEEEKEIYEQNCPFDHNDCGIIGRSITDQYITKTCEKCLRYKNYKTKNYEKRNQ